MRRGSMAGYMTIYKTMPTNVLVRLTLNDGTTTAFMEDLLKLKKASLLTLWVRLYKV